MCSRYNNCLFRHIDSLAEALRLGQNEVLFLVLEPAQTGHVNIKPEGTDGAQAGEEGEEVVLLVEGEPELNDVERCGDLVVEDAVIELIDLKSFDLSIVNFHGDWVLVAADGEGEVNDVAGSRIAVDQELRVYIPHFVCVSLNRVDVAIRREELIRITGFEVAARADATISHCRSAVQLGFLPTVRVESRLVCRHEGDTDGVAG